MSIVYITGLSGTGKSSTINSIRSKGYLAFDIDEGYTIDSSLEGTIIDEYKLENLIKKYQNQDVFISGCYENQGKFYPNFDLVILFDCKLEEMNKRILNRTSNQYGKSIKDWHKIELEYQDVLPLLKRGADFILNTQEITIEQASSFCIQKIEACK
jgi:deoxyadenosine/deoxycytidine kinase